MNTSKLFLTSLRLAAALLAAVLGLGSSVQATLLYWDSNGTGTAGSGATSTGTWGTTNIWNTDSTGAAGGYLTNTTANSDDLFYVAGPGAASGNNNYVVTVSGAQVAKSLTFQASGGTTLSGGTSITLGDGTAGVGGITMNQFAYGAVAQGAVTISTALSLANSQTWTNNSAQNLNWTSLNLGTGTLTFSGTRNFSSPAGTISATAGSIIHNGTGIVFLGRAAGALAYTGTTTISGGGTLQIDDSKPTGNFNLNNGMLTDYYQTTHAFTSGLGTGNNQIQITGNSGLGAGNGTSIWRIGTAGSVLIWGASGEGAATGFFNPTTLKFMTAADNLGPTIYGIVNFDNGINLNGVARTIDVLNASANPTTSGASIAGIISNGSLIKTGGGNLTLGNAGNTYAGTTTISGGFLTVAASGALGSASSSLEFNGGTLRATGTITSPSTRGVTMTQTGIIDNNGQAISFAGNIGGAGGLTKNGAGTLTLSGTTINYGGPTTVNAGTLTVNSPASLPAASAVAVNNGSTLTGSGTFNGAVTVNSGGTLLGTPTVNGAVTATNGSIVPGGYGTLATLTLGSGLTLNGASGITCDLGTTSGSSDTIAITNNLDLNGTNYVAFSVPTGSAATNATYTIMTWTGSQTGSGSLVFPNGSTNMNGATLNLNANSVTITTGGSGITTGDRNVTWSGLSSYVWDSSNTNNWKIGATPTVYAYGDNVTFDDTGLAVSPITGLPANPGSVTNNSSTKNYTIAAPIGGSGGLTKSGNSTLTLSGANTYSGGTGINGGTVLANANANLGVDGSTITFAGSAKLNTSHSAYPVFAKSVAVNNGVVATINEGNQFYKMSFTGPLSGSGTVLFSTGGGGAAGELNFTSAGNTFTGKLQISMTGNGGGGLTVNSLADGANPIQLTGNANSAIFKLGAGTAAPLLFNSRQIDLNGTLAGGGTIQNNNASTANTITINTALVNTNTGNKTLTLGGANTGANTFAGNITNGASGGVLSLTKADAGTWVLSGTNTYTGATTISGGILSINSITNVGAGASAVGAPTTVANGTIAIGSGTTTAGTLNYTGMGNYSDRVLNLAATTTGGATIDHSGTGLLKFTGIITNSGTTKTLTLQGSTAGVGECANIIYNGTGPLALTKSGTGTWVLSGNNTYSGATAVNVGTLLINGNSIAVTNVVTVANNATFGGTNTIGGIVRYQTGSRALFTVTPTSATAYSNTTYMTFTNAAFLTNVTVKVDMPAGLGNGVYVLATNYVVFTTNGSLTFATNSGSLGAGGSGVVSVNGNNLILTVTGVSGNTPPVAYAKTFSVPLGGTITIAVTNGAKTLATDADNDPLTLTSLGVPDAVEFGSATINAGSTNFTYINTNGIAGTNDVFSFIVTDGNGGYATNLITIHIDGIGSNLVSATYSNSIGYMIFAGIPGTNYVLEHTPSLGYPITWTPVQTNMANTNPPIGYIYFQQTLSPSNDYFRTSYQP